MPTITTSIQHSIEDLVTAIAPEKGIKDNRDKRERGKQKNTNRGSWAWTTGRDWLWEWRGGVEGGITVTEQQLKKKCVQAEKEKVTLSPLSDDKIQITVER